MQIKELPAALIAAKPILEQINRAGFEAYFVGGAVRDTLLNKPIHDVDIASSAYPEEIKAIFNKTVDTGIQHGTVMVLDHGQGYEVTTFRTESTYTDFRRPDSVTFVRSLDEDLQRRDFTINAFALQADGTVVDRFDGLADLKAGRIRAVGEPTARFQEDALRMMRALRFAAQLDFTVAPGTLAALTELAPNLQHIAVERIQVEFEKLLQGPGAANSLVLLMQTNLQAYLPGQAADYSLVALQRLAGHLVKQQPETAMLAWVAFLTAMQPTATPLATLVRQWKLSREIMQAVLAVAAAYPQADQLTSLDLYHLGQHRRVLLAVLQLFETDAELIAHLTRLSEALPIQSAKDLALSGGDLIQAGLAAPGPQLGQLLQAITEAVVQGDLANEADAIKSFAKEYQHANS
ncbi:CCA tRNA nucleotidyltransferase [Leuconostocaceae bacterium ESL0958]|nr:CCA tRNA nucleotidyltransferase [Leuconostocaceae bacterium ESL0958]